MRNASQKKPASPAIPFNAKDPKELKNFLSVFAATVPEDDMAALTPDITATMARNHWHLSNTRKRGTPAVKVYTVSTGGRGADARRTAIDIVNDDMPFLVDSVTAELARDYRLIQMLIHPILDVKRDKKGALTDWQSHSKNAESGFTAQSHMHIQLQGTIPEGTEEKLAADLTRILDDVRSATTDWLDMKAKLKSVQESLSKAKTKEPEADIAEYLAFLDYLYRDNFTLLGYREYSFKNKNGVIDSTTVADSGLGLLRNKLEPVYVNGMKQQKLTQEMQKVRLELPALFVSKVNKRSTVHRSVPMDAVSVKLYDKAGNITGEAVFLGLFTSVTYSRSIQDIPLLRRKADAVTSRANFRQGSHDYKALRHILEKYPRDELFQISLDRLVKTSLSILQLQERQRIALYNRADKFGRYISCLVYVPKDRYDTKLRLKMQQILEEELGGKTGNFYTTLDDSPLARVIYTIYIEGNKMPEYKTAPIEAKLQEAGRAWEDRLLSALRELKDDESEIAALSHRYAAAFPASYDEQYDAKSAVYDIAKVESALSGDKFTLDLYCDKSCEAGQLRLKMFNRGTPIVLSDALPILENMGLRVISELPFEVEPKDAGESVWIHDFLMSTASGLGAEQLDQIKDKFEEALSRIWYGDAENDFLNELVISAKLPWRNVVILRSYVRYMRQARSPFDTRTIERAFTRNPDIAFELVELFLNRFDPSREKGRAGNIAKTDAKIQEMLAHVTSLDEDRIIRATLNMIQNTLRTNFFQKGADGQPKSYVSFKLNSGAIDLLPAPRPFREIFVYSPRMEGIHLRMDWISRGGIRWSDRMEDFRTEVLGLMKAQQVKNAVIVPMGAKGGFVVKQPPKEGGRDAFQKEGIECYKTLVRGMLDITDNRKGKKIVAPADVVRHDDEDPYLVVAADKGTATFSDIANGLSQEYGFWLDDAFASGGSVGYDHKKMGITARGAWESVKRHFRELNHDTQTQEFDVVGVGDMGGDVFGNGMLLSEKIRLVGAFNHLHIFCDPAPDAAKTFKERKRLFNEVKGWDHYDTKLLSKGGRIYNRSDKSLTLTPEIMARFDITSEKVTPSELMTAMLKARTDLLFFGGIGTYIKAESESHADVGDKSNDAQRINGSEIRARVVGEGANLATTQLGRIEYALNGGRLNTDFIDNSAGVDCSDHEVNIKILTTAIMEHDKDLTLKKRNVLLAGMTDDVAALVLRDNYQHAQGLSMSERQAASDLPLHTQFIRDLERSGHLNRKLEGLPSDEALARRREKGRGLTRPELCVLLAHSKILFTRDLLNSDIPEKAEMESWAVDYFPAAMRKKYASDIRTHRLKREIVATVVANEVANRMGPTFVKAMADKTGASAADIARAYIIVRESFGLADLWNRIEALDAKVPADTQMKAMREIVLMVEREVLWFLTRLGRAMDIQGDIRVFGEGISALRTQLAKALGPESKAILDSGIDGAMAAGLPRDLATHIAMIPMLASACDIIRISLDRKNSIAETAAVYFALGQTFHIDWLRAQAAFIPANDRWSSEARDGLVEQLYSCQAGLTHRVLKDSGKNVKANAVAVWMDAHPQSRQLEPLLDDMRQTGTLDIPMLMIAEQRLRQLSGT